MKTQGEKKKKELIIPGSAQQQHRAQVL